MTRGNDLGGRGRLDDTRRDAAVRRLSASQITQARLTVARGAVANPHNTTRDLERDDCQQLLAMLGLLPEQPVRRRRRPAPATRPDPCPTTTLDHQKGT